MTPAELSRTVLHAVSRAVEDDALPGPVPERVVVERPRPGGTGDYASNVALRMAGSAGRTAREVAEILRAEIVRAGTLHPRIARVEVTGPGFLNFTLAHDGHADLVRTVLAAGTRYGHGDALAGTTAVFAPAGELRADVWTETVVLLLRSQGATAVVHPGGDEFTRVVPARPGDDLAVGGLFDRLGPDAARWALLRPAAHDRPYGGDGNDASGGRSNGGVAGGAGTDGLLVQRESNPLFRVRYAYARTRALARNADRLGIAPRYAPHTTSHDPAAAPLLTALGDHPAVLEAAARLRAPDRLARHLEHTADAFLRFQESSRPLPLGDEKPSAAHGSRLALADAAGTVLAGGLSLLGIDAPEHL
ncbi:ArgS-related anticodon-binding protein NrtL [Streptomyces sp. NPDC095613]|uniref:ArgS-related anticodon-binding protein NrtL n=1 Tax=Streptomyces sp. NPDC095613 TaxID=3155540 RepID=UPI00331F7560